MFKPLTSHTTHNSLGFIGDVATVKSANTVVIYNSGIGVFSTNIKIIA